MIFIDHQSSLPWFPYSTNIVWHVSRRLRVLSRASGLTASQATESALSSTTTLCFGVALRIGLRVCIPHPCKFETMVDAFGTHTLSCRFSAGRIPRHSALNDVVQRGLSAAGIPSLLETSGLDRGDGKRPDGIRVYPYVAAFSSGTLRVSTRLHLRTQYEPLSPLDPSPTPLKSGKSPSTLSLADASSSNQLLSRRAAPWGNRRSSFLKIWVADLPCDLRINARAISSSRECLWLFSGGTWQ